MKATKKRAIASILLILVVAFCAVACKNDANEKLSGYVSFENVEMITYTHIRVRHDFYVDVTVPVEKTREITAEEREKLSEIVNNSSYRLRRSQNELYQTPNNTMFFYTIYYTDGTSVELGELYIKKYDEQGNEINKGQVVFYGEMKNFDIESKNVPIDLSKDILHQS